MTAIRIPKNATRIQIEIDDKQHQAGWFRARHFLDPRFSNEAQRFHQLSEKLNQVYCEAPDEVIEPKEHEFVGVYDVNAEKWMRGYVLNFNKEGRNVDYTIYFIDYGYTQKIYHLKYLRPLPEWFSTSLLESRSFKVTLSGVVPLEQRFSLAPSQRFQKKTVADNWIQASVTMMLQILKCCDSIYFIPHSSHEEIKFGYIFTIKGNEIKYLHEELKKAGYAGHCDEYGYEWQDRVPFVISSIRKQREFDSDPVVRKQLYPSIPILSGKKESINAFIQPHHYKLMRRLNSDTFDVNDGLNASSKLRDSDKPSDVHCSNFIDQNTVDDRSSSNNEKTLLNTSSNKLEPNVEEEVPSFSDHRQLEHIKSSSSRSSPNHSFKKKQLKNPDRNSISTSDSEIRFKSMNKFKKETINSVSSSRYKTAEEDLTRNKTKLQTPRNEENSRYQSSSIIQKDSLCEKRESISVNDNAVTFQKQRNDADKFKKFIGKNSKSVVGLEPFNNDNVINKILILSSEENVFQPVASFKDFQLDMTTLRNLENLNIRDMTRCQQYIIPAMFTGKNIILVDSPRFGKTDGCLISLVSLLRRSKPNHQKRGVSPRSLIITPYSKKCEDTRARCNSIITGKQDAREIRSQDLRVNFAYGCGNELENEKLIELAHGYDVLVCTPRMLLRLLSKTTFDLDKLEKVVFDDFHILYKNYRSEFRELNEKLPRRNGIQTIIISSEWLSCLKTIFNQPLTATRTILLIPSYLEASNCVHAEYELLMLNENNIDRHIIDVVHQKTSDKTVAILYEDENENKLDTMYYELKTMRSNVYKLTATTYLDQDVINKFKNDCAFGNHPVLLCTDSVLRRLPIYQADVLIHHSLPRDKTSFGDRFAVLLDRFQTLANEKILCNLEVPSPTLQKPQTYIYVNENNRLQLPRVLDIMSGWGAKIPENVTRLLNNIERQKEFLKYSDLCLNIKEMGKCSQGRSCLQRHQLFEQRDVPDPSLPQNGSVEVLISYIYSPVHFRMRLVSHIKDDGTTIDIPSSNISMKLQSYFSKNEAEPFNCKKVGDLAVVETSGTGSSYARVKVVKFKEFLTVTELDGTVFQEPKTALLKFIDSGEIVEKPLTILKKLPPELAEIPEATVDVFICNLLPVDDDTTWGEVLTERVKEKIKEEMKEDKIKFIGKVELVIGRSIWLSSLDTFLYYKYLKKNLAQSFSLTRFLLNSKLGIRNHNHLKTLHSLYNLKLISDNGEESNEEISDTESTSEHIPKFSKKGTDTEVSVIEKETHYNTVIKEVTVEKFTPEENTVTSSSKTEGNQTMDDRKLMISRLKRFLRLPDREVKDEVSENIPPKNTEISSADAHASPGSSPTQANDSSSISCVPESSSTKNLIARKHVNVLRQMMNATSKLSVCVPNVVLNEVSSAREEWMKRPVPPGVSLLTPPVEWRQDHENIYLLFNVNDDDYVFLYDIKNFCFEAKIGSHFYRVIACLFACIDVSKVQHRKSGVEVRVTMPKLTKDENWIRLLKDPKVLPLLKLKVDEIGSDSDTETNYDDSTEFIRSNLPNSIVSELESFYKRPDGYESDNSSNSGSEGDANIED